MGKPISPVDRGWNREDITMIMEELGPLGAEIFPKTKNAAAFQYELIFRPSDGIDVWVEISIADWQVDSDVVISNINTSPEDKRRGLHGSKVVEIIVEWAKKHGFNEIRATQVSNPDSMRFWERHGFVRLPWPNPTGDHLCSFS